ncbi:MAG: DUF3168 domain-containing protein [Devosia sp.]
MENDLRTALISDATIAGLVADRVYPSAYPQNSTASAIRLRKVVGSTGLTHRGSDGLSSAVVQVDLRTATAAEAYALRDAIVARLHPFTGVVDATDFSLISLSSDRGVDFDTSTPTPWFTASVDFNVWWRAA